LRYLIAPGAQVDQRIRIEIKGKDEFWARAFHVEWKDQFSDRELVEDGEGHFLAQPEWLADLERVGKQTFCRVSRAPDNPHRRQWIHALFPRWPK
jgi:hypothetical protein